jgi:hypothetical protein
VLAYLLWHRRRQEVELDAYERAAERFHRSLRHAPPAGFHGSSLIRVGALPWMPDGDWHEDRYLVEDFSALGVLNEAAVAAGHRGAHDQIARRHGSSAGGLYRLIEGRCETVAHPLSVWVSRPSGAQAPGLGDMLGDGMDPQRVGLWRRQMVLGPAPEYWLLSEELPAGAAPARLPQGWRASTVRGEVIFGG